MLFLRPFVPYILAAVIGAGSLGWVWRISAQRDNAVAELAETQAALAGAQAAIRQFREAEASARAEAERLAAKAAEYDEIREWIARNDDKAPIPLVLRSALDRLRNRTPR